MSQVPFANRYWRRTATQDSTCWVCTKFTTTVLTHADLDWFFVCPGHLKDASFCKPIPPPQSPLSQPLSQPSQPGNERPEPPAKQDPSPPTNKPSNPHPKPPSPASAAPASAAPAPEPKEFILDARLFYMRQSQYRSKQQIKQARQLSQTLPNVPARRP